MKVISVTDELGNARQFEQATDGEFVSLAIKASDDSFVFGFIGWRDSRRRQWVIEDAEDNNEDDDDGFYDDSDDQIPLPCNHCNTQQNKYIHRVCLNNFCLDHNCVRCPACGNDALLNVFFKTNYWKIWIFNLKFIIKNNLQLTKSRIYLVMKKVQSHSYLSFYS